MPRRRRKDNQQQTIVLPLMISCQLAVAETTLGENDGEKVDAMSAHYSCLQLAS